MKRLIAFFVSLALPYTAMAANPVAKLPAELTKAGIAGEVFNRGNMEETTHGDGRVTQSVTSLLSSDKIFSTGMYKSGKTRIEISEPYGVDEFMYFL